MLKVDTVLLKRKTDLFISYYYWQLSIACRLNVQLNVIKHCSQKSRKKDNILPTVFSVI